MSNTPDPQIHPTALVAAHVQLGPGCRVGPFVIVGEPAHGQDPAGAPTSLGPGCVLRSHSVLYAGNRIGAGFQTGHGALIREDNVIGEGVTVGSHSVVEHHVQIGDGVRIHSNAFVPEYSVLEARCWIGPGVALTNARYPQSPGAKGNLQGVRIESHARIGAGAILLPGVRVGARALIGAGAVVTHDVPAGAVVAGNPARLIKLLRDIPDYLENS